MAKATKYHTFLSRLILTHVQPNDTVVDFGAGLGTFSGVPPRAKAKIICVKIDDKLRGNLEAQGLTVHRDLNALPTSSVDLVFGFDVLEHINDDCATLRRWKSVLRDDGLALIYVPAFPLLRYLKKELTSKLNDEGFQILSAEYVDCIGFIGSLVYKWLLRSDDDLNWPMVLFYDRFIFPFSRKLDKVFGGICGKNLYVVARKPAAGTLQTHTP
jgi:SAM-dependent methyltransferase